MRTFAPSRLLRAIPRRHRLVLVVGIGLALSGALAFALGAVELAVLAFALFGSLFFAVAIHLHARGGRGQPATPTDSLADLAEQMAPTITRTIARDWSVNSMRISARYEVLEDRVQVLLDDLATQRDALHELLERAPETQQTTLSRLRRLSDGVVADVDALLQLQRRHVVEGGAPVLGGWAMGPAAMLATLELVDEFDCEMVLECGSGASTFYLAANFARRGRGRVVALEHLPEYRDAAQRRLERLGLADHAEIRLAPLRDVEVDGQVFPWYEPDQVADLAKIDLLLVDGPPKSVGTLARYPAVPILADRLTDAAIVVVDDATRPDERDAMARWCHERGWRRRDPGGDLAVLRRPDLAWSGAS